MSEATLKSCPFCGAKLENEAPSKIYCHPKNKCLLSLRGIAVEEFENWNTRKPTESIISQLEDLAQKECDRPDDCDENGCGDGEQIYDDGRSQGKYEAYKIAIRLIKQEGDNGTDK